MNNNNPQKNETEKNATLEYLTNPVYYKSVKKTSDKINNKINKEDIKFYRKRITSLTKEMLKGVFPNEPLKKIYEDYTSSIISHFKMVDTKDIIQQDYKLFNNESTNVLDIDIDIDISINEFSTIEKANEQMLKKVINVSTLDNYVIKSGNNNGNNNENNNENNNGNNNSSLPSKKNIDLHCPTLKTKGVVEKKKKKSKKEGEVKDNREKLENEENEFLYTTINKNN